MLWYDLTNKHDFNWIYELFDDDGMLIFVNCDDGMLLYEHELCHWIMSIFLWDDSSGGELLSLG